MSLLVRVMTGLIAGGLLFLADTPIRFAVLLPWALVFCACGERLARWLSE